MSVGTVRKCDRCGADTFVELYEFGSELTIPLCRNCWNELLHWIENGGKRDGK